MALVKKQRHYLHMTKVSVLSVVFDGIPDGNERNKNLLIWLVDLVGSWSRSRQNWSKSKEKTWLRSKNLFKELVEVETGHIMVEVEERTKEVDVICSRSKNEQRWLT